MASLGFGQYVELQVLTNAGDIRPVFKTDKLRVDFTVSHLGSYERATVQVYNLSDTTLEKITEGLYIRLTVGLHGKKGNTPIASNFYISNVHTEVLLPNKVTTLYCLSNAVGLLQQQLDIVIQPGFTFDYIDLLQITGDITVRKALSHAVYQAKYKAQIGLSKYYGTIFDESLLGTEDVPVDSNSIQIGEALLSPINPNSLIDFPNFEEWDDPVLDALSGMKSLTITGALGDFLKRMAAKNQAKIYSENGRLLFSYTPTSNSVANSTYERTASSPGGRYEVFLENLRTNPSISPAKIELVTNLDQRARTTRIIDTKTLFQAGALSIDVNQETLETAKNYIRNAVKAASPYYQIQQVVHKGSNYTSDWETRIEAYSPNNNITDR